jgi:hypothetical protein
MKPDAISKKYLTAEAAELISAIMRHKGIFFSFSFSGVASLLFVFLSALPPGRRPKALWAGGCDLRGELLCFLSNQTGSFLAGGLPSTLPPEEDWLNPETGPDLEKYIMRKPGISSEKLH